MVSRWCADFPLITPNLHVRSKKNAIYDIFQTLYKAFYKIFLVPENDACVSQPCKNNGICTSVKQQFVCQCQQGYEGAYCEKSKHQYYLINLVQ